VDVFEATRKTKAQERMINGKIPYRVSEMECERASTTMNAWSEVASPSSATAYSCQAKGR
jgi:hypothetical protein